MACLACLALPSRPSCFVEAPSAASLPLQTDAYGLWVFFIPGHKELQTECNVDKRGQAIHGRDGFERSRWFARTHAGAKRKRKDAVFSSSQSAACNATYIDESHSSESVLLPRCSKIGGTYIGRYVSEYIVASHWPIAPEEGHITKDRERSGFVISIGIADRLAVMK